jgi:MOSC domain-containing protein YiiM
LVDAGRTRHDGVVTARVVGVHSDASHSFSKPSRSSITLLAGLGVEGDAHCGATMQHLGRLPRQATWPNLRQVHLIHAELHDDLAGRGFAVEPGDMGENITTREIDLLGLPTGALLHLGDDAVVEITGLRNPCVQLDRFQDGLREATLARDADGELVRLAGVMGVVAAGGVVRPGDPITVELPPEPHDPLHPV